LLTSFVNRYFLPIDYEEQKTYLDLAQKPRSMSVEDLSARLEEINILMSLLNNGNNPYTDQELKIKFFKMMPEPWQRRYFENGHRLMDATQTMDVIRQYMQIQESSADRRRAAPNDLGPANGGKRARGRGGRYDRGGGQQANPNDNDNESPNNDNGYYNNNNHGDRGNCPFHPTMTHDWEQCFGNPHGPNYRATYQLPAPGGTQRHTTRTRNPYTYNRSDNERTRQPNTNSNSTNNNNNNNTNSTNNNRNNNASSNAGSNAARSVDAHICDEQNAPDTNNTSSSCDTHWFDDLPDHH